MRDLGTEQFVLHHLCSTTAETILRLFDQNGTRCRIVAELWSFENIKSFVQEEVGHGDRARRHRPAGAPRRHAGAHPAARARVPRRTLMIYREQGYMSDTARELIKIVRAFNWDQGFNDKQQNRAPIAALEPTELRNRIRRVQGRLESFRVQGSRISRSQEARSESKTLLGS